MMKIPLLVVFLSFLSATNAAGPYKCQGVANYWLSFYGMWSNDTHPNAFPSDGHFSSILGISHEGDYSMWGPGMNATPGVKEVAENGG